MTQTYYPFDSGAGGSTTEAQWTKMAQHWLVSGVIKSMLNELQVHADSTGMQVKVKSGQAWIKGHFYESDAEEVLSIGAADATNPRIDRVIVRLDWTLNTIQLAVLQGISAVSPTAPTLTQNTSRWEISLAQVRVNAGVTTIAVGDVTSEREFTSNVIESGSNSNGTYTRFPDGTQICTFVTSFIGTGVAFYNDERSYPANFANDEVAISVTGYNNSAGHTSGSLVRGYTTSLSSGTKYRYGIEFDSAKGSSTSITVRVIMIGRWR